MMAFLDEENWPESFVKVRCEGCMLMIESVPNVRHISRLMVAGVIIFEMDSF